MFEEEEEEESVTLDVVASRLRPVVFEELLLPEQATPTQGLAIEKGAAPRLTEQRPRMKERETAIVEGYCLIC